MIIIATGNYRTGSTLVFNLAREMCLQYANGREVIHYGYTDEELAGLVKHNDESKIYICKSHEYLPDEDYPGLYCLHTIRGMLDAFASSVLIKGTVLDDYTIASIKHQAERDSIAIGFAESLKYSCIKVFHYNQFYWNLPWLVWPLARYLGFPLTAEFADHLVSEYAVEKVKAKYENFSEEHDTEKWFRPNHVSKYVGKPGYYTEVLTTEQIEKIQSIVKQD